MFESRHLLLAALDIGRVDIDPVEGASGVERCTAFGILVSLISASIKRKHRDSFVFRAVVYVTNLHLYLQDIPVLTKEGCPGARCPSLTVAGERVFLAVLLCCVGLENLIAMRV